ncbi:hypothetical protein ACIPW9_36440 [Streptomyces sp. NPDC090052]|uniref:hypothetical protein n=1 Tax=Streptomyces sp. NPDC090052 TaxID=3365931 RepID=UPI0038036BAC
MAKQKTLSAEEQAELAARAPLVELKRSAEAARAEAMAGPYSPERWAPWQAAAQELHAAITQHAAAHGVNRFEVESWVTYQVLHAEDNDSA